MNFSSISDNVVKNTKKVLNNTTKCIKQTHSPLEETRFTDIPIDYKFSYIPSSNSTLSKSKWQDLVFDLDKKITKKNLLGSGSEADVYNINNDYVLRILGGENKIKNHKFVPVEDIFEGKNFGQAVAKNDEGITINKKVNGTKIYNIRENNPKKYMEQLREYSELPDETLENFVSDIAFINSKGYRIDQSNPENFLYDRVNKSIGIIDLQKQDSSSLDLFEPYAHDWIVDPLINGHDIFEIYNKLEPHERKEMFELIGKIENRVLPLCEKYGIPKAKWNKNDYMFSSVLNVLELKETVDCSKDLFGQIIYSKYPSLIKKYEKYIQNKIANT